MTPTLRAELDRIEDFLMGPEGKELAYVLAALRGPDSEDRRLKFSTTNYIRVTAFPRLASQTCYIPGEPHTTALSAWDLQLEPWEPPLPEYLAPDHFGYHITKAAEVLGLVAEVTPIE